MKAPITFFLFFLTLTSFAQTYPSPEFNNEPAYYDSSSRTVTPLEKSQYNRLTQAKGLMGKESGFFLNQGASPVRFKHAGALQFIVKVIPGTNPGTILDLVAFEVRGDQRVLITTKLTHAGTKSTTAYVKIPFEVKRVGDGLYLLTARNLTPGEYLLGSHDNMFAFGIDN